MKAIVQRVSSARVLVDGEVVGSCGRGFLVLVAAGREDTEAEARKVADKVAGLRVFNDLHGKMNLGLKNLPSSHEPNVLAVSNFTLYGDTKGNRRPSFTAAASYEEGQALFDVFVQELRALGCHVSTGVFGADMQVELVNDGPVTICVEVP